MADPTPPPPMQSKPPAWETSVTFVGPNTLLAAGYPLQDLIGRRGLLDVAALLCQGDLPGADASAELTRTALRAAARPGSGLAGLAEGVVAEDVSKRLARELLSDPGLAAQASRPEAGRAAVASYTLGRMLRYLADAHGTVLPTDPDTLTAGGDYGFWLAVALGCTPPRAQHLAKTIESLAVACVDHGVTPPSAQATRLAASVRAAYEVAVAHGVGAITDVHGGAGAAAAVFFSGCVRRAEAEGIEPVEALRSAAREALSAKRRLAGLGHRVHTRDPRRDALWALTASAGLAGPAMALSQAAESVMLELRGKPLPVNVDGVVGAIVADLGLAPAVAKSLFIVGRVAGLSAHYFEEVATQPRMRRIHFAAALYAGPELRNLG